jgi:hypothetical protein
MVIIYLIDGTNVVDGIELLVKKSRKRNYLSPEEICNKTTSYHSTLNDTMSK